MDEPPSVFKKLPTNGTLFTLIFFVGNLLILAGSLWVSNGYVSKATFETYVQTDSDRRERRSDELKQIAVKMAELVAAQEKDKEQNRRLENLERDVREIEKRKP